MRGLHNYASSLFPLLPFNSGDKSLGASALGGDSGSPVYTVEGVGVRLSGIVWGGDSKRFLFSPITGIERDLGATLTVK